MGMRIGAPIHTHLYATHIDGYEDRPPPPLCSSPACTSSLRPRTLVCLRPNALVGPPPRHTNGGERGALMREANANLTNLTSSVKLASAYEIRLHGIRVRQMGFVFFVRLPAPTSAGHVFYAIKKKR
jgi:hypothetical protein